MRAVSSLSKASAALTHASETEAYREMFERREILECYLMELVRIGKLIRMSEFVEFSRGFYITDPSRRAEIQRGCKRERQRRLVLQGRCVNCGARLAAASKYKCEYHLGLARESANKRNARKRAARP